MVSIRRNWFHSIHTNGECSCVIREPTVEVTQSKTVALLYCLIGLFSGEIETLLGLSAIVFPRLLVGMGECSFKCIMTSRSVSACFYRRKANLLRLEFLKPAAMDLVV